MEGSKNYRRRRKTSGMSHASRRDRRPTILFCCSLFLIFLLPFPSYFVFSPSIPCQLTLLLFLRFCLFYISLYSLPIPLPFFLPSPLLFLPRTNPSNKTNSMGLTSPLFAPPSLRLNDRRSRSHPSPRLRVILLCQHLPLLPLAAGATSASFRERNETAWIIRKS